jgi:secondary thiamine-phosphate synthase enzyme
MDTLTALSICRNTTIQIATDRPTVFVDLTSRIETLVAEAGMGTGLVNIQTRHTTTAIVVNEHEPLLLGDFANLLEQTAPRLAAYRHDSFARARGGRDEPANGHAHCRALLLCPSASLNVTGGQLQLGRWQRIFLAELDGPRIREVSILLLGEAAR